MYALLHRENPRQIQTVIHCAVSDIEVRGTQSAQFEETNTHTPENLPVLVLVWF